MLPAQKGDSIECDEIWAFTGSKKTPAWIWLSWSYQTTQALSFAVGKRNTQTGRIMWQAIPKSYARKQVYTDEYVCYETLIQRSRHWLCPKGSGRTNVAEGCDNYLRHRVSYLVRKSPSFARGVEWLKRRLFLVLYYRN